LDCFLRQDDLLQIVDDIGVRVDRGVPLHEIDPNANVINDLKKIILPEEAVQPRAKSRSLFGMGRGLLKRKAG